MKDDLVGHLSEDRGGLGSLRDVLVHFGNETWGIRVPWPPPRWRSASKALLTEVVRGTIQSHPADIHGHDWAQKHFMPGRCVKHWRIARCLGVFPEGSIFLGHSQRQCSYMVSYLDTLKAYSE